MTENSETICAFTISLEHKTTYAHFHMFFFPHVENILPKLGLKVEQKIIKKKKKKKIEASINLGWVKLANL